MVYSWHALTTSENSVSVSNLWKFEIHFLKEENMLRYSVDVYVTAKVRKM